MEQSTVRHRFVLGTGVWVAWVVVTGARADEPLYDCSPLDPRIQLTQKSEEKANAGAKTLYKIVEAGANVEKNVSSVSRNLADVPASEQANVKYRLLYLLCQMMSRDNIDKDKKAEMYMTIMNRMLPAEPTVGPASEARSPPAKSLPASSPAQAQMHAVGPASEVSPPPSDDWAARAKQQRDEWFRQHEQQELREQAAAVPPPTVPPASHSSPASKAECKALRRDAAAGDRDAEILFSLLCPGTK